MTQKKVKGKSSTPIPRKGRSPTSHVSPYVPTPSPVGSASLLRTHHLRQRSSKRLFQEDSDDLYGWDSLEEGIWMKIIELVEPTHKESVVHLGMCSRNLRTIVSKNYAPKMSLRSMYVKLPTMSPKLLDSLNEWWKVHSNVNAGIMHGVYQAWYAGNWSKGLETLTEVAAHTNDPEAIYMANVVYRSYQCNAVEPPPAGETFIKGGINNDKLSAYRTNLRIMVNCLAMLSFRRGYRCNDVSDTHPSICHRNVPREEFDCSNCLFDVEAYYLRHSFS